MNKSPQARPNVSTKVANKPELIVPLANAVGITLLNVDPITPSNACIDKYDKKYPVIYLAGVTAKTLVLLYDFVGVPTSKSDISINKNKPVKPPHTKNFIKT